MITRDMELAVFVGRVLLVIAVLTTTFFPFLYAFSPWYKSKLGQAVMLQAVTLALAVWIKFVLTFFLEEGPRTLLLWINVAVLAFIVIATAIKSYVLFTIRRDVKRKIKELENVFNAE